MAQNDPYGVSTAQGKMAPDCADGADCARRHRQRMPQDGANGTRHRQRKTAQDGARRRKTAQDGADSAPTELATLSARGAIF